MEGRCLYCDWVGSTQGIKSHIRGKHPKEYAEWGFTQIDSPSTGKIRKEYLSPEDSTENAVYGRYIASQRSDDAKKMVLVDGNREPVPDVSEPRQVVELPEAQVAAKMDKKYRCSGCEEPFDDFIWMNGEAHCPICEIMLDKDAIDDA